MKYISERATCNYTWFGAALRGELLFFFSTASWRIVHRLYMRHSQPQRPKGASSPDFISHTHTSRHLAGSLLQLCWLWQRERQRVRQHMAPKPAQSDTIRVWGQKEKTFFFSFPFFFSQIKPLQDSVCGHVAQIWGLPADRPAMHA